MEVYIIKKIKRQFMNTGKWLGGKKAQKNGKNFEEILIRYCNREGIVFKKTDPPYRQVGDKIWRTKSGIDFIFGKNSVAVFVDAKSVDSDRISYSFLKPHQLQDLTYWQSAGFAAGLIVWFRVPNIISFIPIDDLLILTPGSSIKFMDTIQLGSIYDMRLDRLFNWEKERIQRLPKSP